MTVLKHRLLPFVVIAAVIAMVATRPRAVVQSGTALVDACDRITDKISHLLTPPMRCPWSQECI